MCIAQSHMSQKRSFSSWPGTRQLLHVLHSMHSHVLSALQCFHSASANWRHFLCPLLEHLEHCSSFPGTSFWQQNPQYCLGSLLGATLGFFWYGMSEVARRFLCLRTEKSGKKFRVGIFLDFVWLTTRTPHGAYVRGARRNRIDPHGGKIERLAALTPRAWGASQGLLTKKCGNTFRVGIFS